MIAARVEVGVEAGEMWTFDMVPDTTVAVPALRRITSDGVRGSRGSKTLPRGPYGTNLDRQRHPKGSAMHTGTGTFGTPSRHKGCAVSNNLPIRVFPT